MVEFALTRLNHPNFEMEKIAALVARRLSPCARGAALDGSTVHVHAALWVDCPGQWFARASVTVQFMAERCVWLACTRTLNYPTAIVGVSWASVSSLAVGMTSAIAR